MSPLQILAPTPAMRRAARPRTCTECGASFEAARAHGDFCGQPCRKAWNNRRLVRGAELYDLFMALRFDRAVATRFKVWRLICRMASMFREEDVAQRAGRKSWRAPRLIAERHAHLQAATIVRGRRP